MRSTTLMMSAGAVGATHVGERLRFRHGAVYEDYKREVRRWLPRKPRPILETVPPFEVRR